MHRSGQPKNGTARSENRGGEQYQERGHLDQGVRSLRYERYRRRHPVGIGHRTFRAAVRLRRLSAKRRPRTTAAMLTAIDVERWSIADKRFNAIDVGSSGVDRAHRETARAGWSREGDRGDGCSRMKAALRTDVLAAGVREAERGARVGPDARRVRGT